MEKEKTQGLASSSTTSNVVSATVEGEEPTNKPFTDDMAIPKVARTGSPKPSRRKNYIPKKCLELGSLTHSLPSTLHELYTSSSLQPSAFGSVYRVEFKRPSIYPPLQRFSISANKDSQNRRFANTSPPSMPKHSINIYRYHRCMNCGSKFTQSSNLRKH